MAVSPNYFITGVWKTDNNITHVLLHENTVDHFKAGIKTTEAKVISLIRAGYSVMTLRWSYQSAGWYRGAFIEIVGNGEDAYIRTHKDASVSDNLDNIIQLNGVVSGL